MALVSKPRNGPKIGKSVIENTENLENNCPSLKIRPSPGKNTFLVYNFNTGEICRLTGLATLPAGKQTISRVNDFKSRLGSLIPTIRHTRYVTASPCFYTNILATFWYHYQN
jgi:hypothetical protein